MDTVELLNGDAGRPNLSTGERFFMGFCETRPSSEDVDDFGAIAAVLSRLHVSPSRRKPAGVVRDTSYVSRGFRAIFAKTTFPLPLGAKLPSVIGGYLAWILTEQAQAFTR